MPHVRINCFVFSMRKEEKKVPKTKANAIDHFSTDASEGSEGAVKSNVLFMSLVTESSSVHRNGN